MILATSSAEAERYLAACDLLEIIDADVASELIERRELLASGVAAARVHALYPLDEERLGAAIISKLAEEKVLLRFLVKSMNAYNQGEFDDVVGSASTEALDWAEDLALKNAKLPLHGKAPRPPAGWVSKHVATQLFDVLVSLHTVLHTLMNWNEVRCGFYEEARDDSGTHEADAARELAARDAQIEQWRAVMTPIFAAL